MPHPDPTAFTLFGLDVQWYGICIGLGFLLAILLSYRRAPRLQIEPDFIIDFAIWLIPLSIVGARAYYVLFNWDRYGKDLASILDVRGGGLAIHGGLIVGVLVAFALCRKRQVSFRNLADLIFPQVALAQAIGRWGNFFNGEAHGGPTDLPWAIEVDGQLVHPTFLYESLWCLFLFAFLVWLTKRRSFQGQIGLLYGMLYSLERGLVEQLRTDSLMIGPFKQAQVLSGCVFLLCLAAYVLLQQRQHKESKVK